MSLCVRDFPKGPPIVHSISLAGPSGPSRGFVPPGRRDTTNKLATSNPEEYTPLSLLPSDPLLLKFEVRNAPAVLTVAGLLFTSFCELSSVK
jgi:hypothetical protein